MDIESEKRKWPTVSVATIATILISMFLGFLLDRLFINLLGESTLTFSTVGLLGFAFSIVAAGASIVLAIVAIFLGRSSEQAVVHRADESIRLQTETFTKTTEALQKIASSTGVTEKRIEDIIPHLVELGRSGRSPKEIESEMRDRLREKVDPDELERRTVELTKRRELYEQFKNRVLKSFSAKDKFIAEKMGDGSFVGEGLELFDGVYRYEGSIAGVSAFDDLGVLDPTMLKPYVFRVGEAIFEKKVDCAYLVVKAETSTGSQLEELINETLSIVKDDPGERIKVLEGTLENVEQLIANVEPPTYETAEPSGEPKNTGSTEEQALRTASAV